MPSLLVTGGPLSGHELVVESQVVLGRGDADIVIDDPEISRRHALMNARDGAIEIEDLDSLNGTWVNEQRIESSVRLATGDVIRLGQTTMEVKAPPRPAVTEYEPQPVVEPEARRPRSSPRRRSSGPPSSRSGLDAARSATRRSPVRLASARTAASSSAPSGQARHLPRSPLASTRSRRPASTSCAPSPPCSPTSSARPPSASDWRRTR